VEPGPASPKVLPRTESTTLHGAAGASFVPHGRWFNRDWNRRPSTSRHLLLPNAELFSSFGRDFMARGTRSASHEPTKGLLHPSLTKKVVANTYHPIATLRRLKNKEQSKKSSPRTQTSPASSLIITFGHPAQPSHDAIETPLMSCRLEMTSMPGTSKV
jgi:hypothetical protein